MKKFSAYIVVALSLLTLGILAQRYLQINPFNSALKQPPGMSAEKKPLYWAAPMDPAYRRDKPGKSPMGMDLVPVYAEAENDEDDNAIKISPAVEQNLGVRTAIVTRLKLTKRIDTVGYVIANENRIEHIHSYTDGWIKRLLVKTTGEHVQNGQLLLELYSPTLINAQEEYLLAIQSANKTLINAANRKLLALGVDKRQIREIKKTNKPMELVKIYASQSGIVSELNVREGMYVKPDRDIITLEDLSNIWIIGEVFERQSQWVKEEQPAHASLPYIPGKKWKGKVDFVYPKLDPVTHTLKVRLRFDNPKETLKPNMYADITIFTSPEENALAIPREAVIYTEEGARVILSLGQGRYAAKTVQLGIESGDQIAVLRGLQEGEKIVISAQFLIDSESSLKASFNRMNIDEQTIPQDHHH